MIVARTKMGGGRVCIGALSEQGENLRLLSPTCGYEQSALQTGQLWDITFDRCKITPPHGEDVAVVQQVQRKQDVDVREFVLERVKILKGTISELFEGKIRFTSSGSGYISATNGLPDGATGFWLPSTPLYLEEAPRGALYGPHQDYRHLKYVGFPGPIAIIPAGQLVRVSLAKWWKPADASPDFEERCYAQLSGWL
jgi:hypothetical protein